MNNEIQSAQNLKLLQVAAWRRKMDNTGMVAALEGLGVLGVVAIALIIWVIAIIAYWKIFVKAGQAGWKSIIPVYNEYIAFKIAWKPMIFWILIGIGVISGICGLPQVQGNAIAAIISFVCSVAIFVLHITFSNKLAESFGKGIGFTIGLVFLPYIFEIILGFGKAEYLGPQDKPQDK